MQLQNFMLVLGILFSNYATALFRPTNIKRLTARTRHINTTPSKPQRIDRKTPFDHPLKKEPVQKEAPRRQEIEEKSKLQKSFFKSLLATMGITSFLGYTAQTLAEQKEQKKIEIQKATQAELAALKEYEQYAKTGAQDQNSLTHLRELMHKITSDAGRSQLLRINVAYGLTALMQEYYGKKLQEKIKKLEDIHRRHGNPGGPESKHGKAFAEVIQLLDPTLEDPQKSLPAKVVLLTYALDHNQASIVKDYLSPIGLLYDHAGPLLATSMDSWKKEGKEKERLQKLFDALMQYRTSKLFWRKVISRTRINMTPYEQNMLNDLLKASDKVGLDLRKQWQEYNVGYSSRFINWLNGWQ